MQVVVVRVWSKVSRTVKFGARKAWPFDEMSLRCVWLTPSPIPTHRMVIPACLVESACVTIVVPESCPSVIKIRMSALSGRLPAAGLRNSSSRAVRKPAAISVCPPLWNKPPTATTRLSRPLCARKSNSTDPESLKVATANWKRSGSAPTGKRPSVTVRLTNSFIWAQPSLVLPLTSSRNTMSADPQPGGEGGGGGGERILSYSSTLWYRNGRARGLWYRWLNLYPGIANIKLSECTLHSLFFSDVYNVFQVARIVKVITCRSYWWRILCHSILRKFKFAIEIVHVTN